MKLTTENSSNRYFVRSMGKVHQITHFALSEESHKHQFDKYDRICVSTMPGHDHIQLMANRYAGDNAKTLSDLSTKDKPFSNLYIEAYDMTIYQVSHVCSSDDEANQIMLERPDVALIDSTKMKELDVQLHFLASLKQVR